MFWKVLVQKPIKVFEISVLFDVINPEKSLDLICQNPGIGNRDLTSFLGFRRGLAGNGNDDDHGCDFDGNDDDGIEYFS